MKSLISLAVVGLLAVNQASGSNFTQANTEKVQEIIAAAVEAHGGEALLEELRTVRVAHKTTGYAVDQSRGTEPPWDENTSSGVDAIDLDGEIFFTRAINNGGGFVGENATVISAEQSVQVNYRAGTVQEIAEPDYATTSGPFVRITPALLLRSLNDRRANAHYLGETKADGETYDVIGFSMTVGPAISLYFDKDRVLRRSERVLPGFGLVEYRFDNYVTVAGILFNRDFTLYLNGDVNLERAQSSIRVNESLDDLLVVDVDLEAIPVLEPDPLSRQELADGVWLIGGNGTYGMFVDMGDYVFAAGGTGGSADRIESLREVVADKPIKYAMMTHHHFDHVAAIGDYESEGATIITAHEHETIVRRAAENGEALEVRKVKSRMKLGKGDRRVEIINIGPTAHTEHLLVAYLPEEKLLFEADHFTLPRVGPIPPAVPSTISFAQALSRHKLGVEKIVSAHSPRVATMDDLNTALQAEVMQAQR